MNAPVVIFAFNRADQLRMTLRNLVCAEGIGDRDVIMYIDGPRNDRDVAGVNEVLQLAEGYQCHKLPNMEIRCRERNYGCQQNISDAITNVLEKYEKIIVVEDDVLVSKYFLSYMDEALEFYRNDKRIWGINGHQAPYVSVPCDYEYDVYLTKRNNCTGWGTWLDRWQMVDFAILDWPKFKEDEACVKELMDAGWDIKGMLDSHYMGKLNSWALPCTFCIVKNCMFVIEPVKPLTKNVGFRAATAVHGVRSAAWDKQKYYEFLPKLTAELEWNEKLAKSFRYAYSDTRLMGRIVRKFHRMALSCFSCHDIAIPYKRKRGAE